MSSPGQETLRGAFPLNSSLSLDHASLLQRDALEEEESSDVEEEKPRDLFLFLLIVYFEWPAFRGWPSLSVHGRQVKQH